MPESIASRVGRIIAGATHALIDRAENLAPEAVMAQSIRDIEQVIAEVRIDLGKAEAAKHLVLAQLAKLQDEHSRLSSQIDTAITQERDDLAQAALAKQVDIEDSLPVLQKSLDEQNQRAEALEGHILALLAKRRELAQVLAEYRRQTEETAAAPAATSDRQGRVEQAEAVFERVLSNGLGVSGLAAGAAEDAAKLRELLELQKTTRIAERLAALKAAKIS
jgi:phage shock protein A